MEIIDFSETIRLLNSCFYQIVQKKKKTAAYLALALALALVLALVLACYSDLFG